MGILLLGQSASAPVSDGRSLLNFPTGWQDYTFKNFAQNSATLSGTAADDYPQYLDKYGFPTATLPSAITFVPQVPPSYGGNWAVSFDGVGCIRFASAGCSIVSDVDSCAVNSGGSITITSNTASEARGTTRIVISATARGTFSFNFPASVAKYSNVGGSAPDQLSSMQNLILCRADAPYTGDEAAILSGNLDRAFNQDMLDLIADLNPKILRLMGLAFTNGTSTPCFTNYPPVGSANYLSQRWDPLNWAGVTSAGVLTGEYAIAASPGTPGSYTNGEQIQLRYHAAQPAVVNVSSVNSVTSSTITLTIADTSTFTTGQKVFAQLPGLTEIANVIATSGLNFYYTVTVVNSTQLQLTALNSFAGTYTSGGKIFICPTIDVANRGPKMVFNSQGVVPSLNVFGSNPIATNSQATLTYSDILGGWTQVLGAHLPGPPPAILGALANASGMDIWVCLGVGVTDADAATIASTIHSTMNSNLNCYFELGNENWNSAFPQYGYLHSLGHRWGFVVSSAQALSSAWAYRFGKINAEIKALGHSNLKTALAFQGAGNSTIDTYLLSASLLKSTSTAYWAYDPTDFSVAPNRPGDLCDVLSYGMYVYGPNVLQSDAEWSQSFFNPPKDAAYYAPLLAAADAYDAGDTSQVAYVDNDIRYGTYPRFEVTIAADGTVTCVSGTAASHSIANGVVVQVFHEVGESLPSPLINGTTKNYYVVNTSGSTFKLALTSGGAAITGLSGGSGTFMCGIGNANTILYWCTDRLNFWNAYAVTYDKPIIIYEAASSAWFPPIARCTTLGIDTAYSQKILNLVMGWQNSDLARVNTIDLCEGFSVGSKSLYTGQLQVVGPNQWAMLNGYTAPISGSSTTFLGDMYQTPNGRYQGFKEFNS